MHRFTLTFVVLLLGLVGCGRDSGSHEGSADSNRGDIEHTDDSKHARRHQDNTVHIRSAQADLEADEQRIEFGKAKQGKLFLHPFEVENTRSEPVVVDTITSSCECFSIPGLPRRIPAKRRTMVACAIDLSTDPDFHGDLAIDVHLQSGGKDVAVFKAAFSVTPEKTESHEDPHTKTEGPHTK